MLATLAAMERPADAPDETEEQARWRELEELHYHRYLAGELDYQGQRRARVRDFLAPYGAELDDPAAEAWFEEYSQRYRAAFRLHADALPCLDDLARHGIRFGIITNGDLAFQTAKLHALGITDRFEHVITSGELGVAKPDRRIFAVAAERFGVRPDACAYVGDRLWTDALGATQRRDARHLARPRDRRGRPVGPRRGAAPRRPGAHRARRPARAARTDGGGVTTTADIAIIGGGIAGFSLAAAIGGRARTVLLEAEPQLFHHTSSRSAEQMQPTYGPAPVRRLTSASIPRVQAIAEGLGRPIFTPRPLLWVGTTPDRTHLDELLATVLGLEEIDPAEAVALLPALRPDAVHAAGIDRSAVEVDVPALLEAYRAAAVAGGVEVLPSARVERAERIGDAWRLTAGATVVEAAVVVNAAGAWVERIAATVRRPAARSPAAPPHRRRGRPDRASGGSGLADGLRRARHLLLPATRQRRARVGARGRAERAGGRAAARRRSSRPCSQRVNAATDLALRGHRDHLDGPADPRPRLAAGRRPRRLTSRASTGSRGRAATASRRPRRSAPSSRTTCSARRRPIPGLEGVLADLSPARDALPA